MNEKELIKRAQRGKDAAWAALLGKHQEAVFRFAYLQLGDADEAEDVAQEVFIRAYRNIHRFDTTRPFRPCLLSIVANQARNRRRSLGRYWAALKRGRPDVNESRRELEEDS